MAQQTSVPMETQALDEPKNAVKHTATPTSTPSVNSKAKAMPPEPAKLALPPPEVTTSSSSSSSKQLTQGTAKNRSTSRKGTKTETDEPEGLPKRGRASTVDEKPIEQTQTKKRSKPLEHSTVKYTTTDIEYWTDKSVGYIREQLVTHYDMRFGDPTDGMLYTRPKGGNIPANKMTKADYLRETKKVLNQQ